MLLWLDASVGVGSCQLVSCRLGFTLYKFIWRGPSMGPNQVRSWLGSIDGPAPQTSTWFRDIDGPKTCISERLSLLVRDTQFLVVAASGRKSQGCLGGHLTSWMCPRDFHRRLTSTPTFATSYARLVIGNLGGAVCNCELEVSVKPY